LELDCRIHFALNCGVKDCPAIAFYNSEKINEQLEFAKISFLQAETTLNSEKNNHHFQIITLVQW
jgi:uncharacterized protein (UPF0179 family)